METIFAAIILVVIAFGILIVSKSDASASEKAMLIVIICVGGVIGGAIIGGLLLSSPGIGAAALVLIGIFVVTFIKSLFKDSSENKKFARESQVSDTVSNASADTVMRIFENTKVGDTKNFGKYRWVVAEVEGDKAMLVTDRVILNMEFNKKAENVTWQDCTLRKYLNETFLKNNFGEGERSLILDTVLENSTGLSYEKKELPETTDKIFLWSYEEAQAHENFVKCTPPSDYGARRCWTRTTRSTWTYAYDCVSGFGFPPYDNVYYVTGGVRPVMWVKIK